MKFYLLYNTEDDYIYDCVGESIDEIKDYLSVFEDKGDVSAIKIVELDANCLKFIEED